MAGKWSKLVVNYRTEIIMLTPCQCSIYLDKVEHDILEENPLVEMPTMLGPELVCYQVHPMRRGWHLRQKFGFQ